jgi:hypothetical protein
MTDILASILVFPNSTNYTYKDLNLRNDFKSSREIEYLGTLKKLMNLTACIHDTHLAEKELFSTMSRHFFNPVAELMNGYNPKCIFNTDFCENILHHGARNILSESKMVSVSIEYGAFSHFRLSKYGNTNKLSSDSIVDYVVDLEAFFILIMSSK